MKSTRRKKTNDPTSKCLHFLNNQTIRTSCMKQRKIQVPEITDPKNQNATQSGLECLEP